MEGLHSENNKLNVEPYSSDEQIPIFDLPDAPYYAQGVENIDMNDPAIVLEDGDKNTQIDFNFDCNFDIPEDIAIPSVDVISQGGNRISWFSNQEEDYKKRVDKHKSHLSSNDGAVNLKSVNDGYMNNNSEKYMDFSCEYVSERRDLMNIVDEGSDIMIDMKTLDITDKFIENVNDESNSATTEENNDDIVVMNREYVSVDLKKYVDKEISEENRFSGEEVVSCSESVKSMNKGEKEYLSSSNKDDGEISPNLNKINKEILTKEIKVINKDDKERTSKKMKLKNKDDKATTNSKKMNVISKEGKDMRSTSKKINIMNKNDKENKLVPSIRVRTKKLSDEHQVGMGDVKKTSKVINDKDNVSTKTYNTQSINAQREPLKTNNANSQRLLRDVSKSAVPAKRYEWVPTICQSPMLLTKKRAEEKLQSQLNSAPSTTSSHSVTKKPWRS